MNLISAGSQSPILPGKFYNLSTQSDSSDFRKLISPFLRQLNPISGHMHRLLSHAAMQDYTHSHLFVVSCSLFTYF